MRFRRISFPISAVLSIAAMLLFFFNGLNLGVDFVGGTLMEVQSKAGPADLAKMRSAVGSLNLGEAQLQQFGAPTVSTAGETGPGATSRRGALIAVPQGVAGARSGIASKCWV